jgi:hypothetical protein
MAKVSVSTNVSTGPEKVWQLAVDLPRQVDWNSMHEGFTGEVPPVLAEGVAYKQRVKLMGMPAEIAWQVTSAEAPRRLELNGDGPMGVKAVNVWLIEPSGEGSKITLEMEFTGSGLSGPMGMMVEKQAKTAIKGSLEKFAALLG